MEKLGQVEIIKSPGLLFGERLCEQCKCRVRWHDGHTLRKWCRRCVDVYHRRESLNREKAEQVIFDQVGALYYQATLEQLDALLQEKLLGLADSDDVFITGLIGTGKTFTMAALLRHYVYQGYDCKRIIFDDFCVQVRSTFGPASKLSEWDLIEPLKQADKLFIDDLGLRSKAESDFAYVTLFSILNRRQEIRLPTIISSNKSIAQLERSFDSRIASRLQTGVIVQMTGADRRTTRPTGSRHVVCSSVADGVESTNGSRKDIGNRSFQI